jgi:hypothetical protein
MCPSKVFWGLLILFPIIFCFIRFSNQHAFNIPVAAVYSINHRDVSLHDYQLFRVIVRSNEDFILKLYLKNYLLEGKKRSTNDIVNKDFTLTPFYSYFDGVWKVEFFIWCSKQHASIFISNRSKVDKSQLNHNKTKNNRTNSNCIRWIVVPTGRDYETTKINPDVMCSIITGIDDNGKHNYQVMVGTQCPKK